MRTLETDAEVKSDGNLKLLSPMPSWLKPGRRHVLLMVEEESARSGEGAIGHLRDIAREGGLGITNPSAWQREQRRDRKTPGEH